MRDFVRMPLNRFSFGCFFITIIRTWCVAAQQLGAKPAPSCRTKNRCFTTNLPSSAIPTIEKNEKRGFTQLQEAMDRWTQYEHFGAQHCGLSRTQL
jgi:hypothetical protein